MSPNCIRTSSAEFQQLAKDLNVSEHSLELLAHEYNMLKQDQNGIAYLSSEGRSWLNNRLNGISQEALPNTVQLWKDNYSKPQVFTNAEDANAAYSDAVSYFGSQATVLKETYDGKYELKVAEPVVVTRDTDGNLLAPNEEKSKLSLQQYIQVRTKAFMDWFGDWINDPENASKVVDPVTKEPMVVYRGSQTGIQNDSKLYMYFSNSQGDASIYAQGQFTKGGQLFANNQNIKNGIIQYIKDKYGIKHRPDMDTMLDLLENRDSKGKLLGRQNTEEENKYIEFAQKYFEHKIQDKKLYDFVEMFELINDTTLSSEYDLFKQYDDTDYIHNKSKLDKLFDIYRDDIAKFKNNKSGIVDNVFLNIRTPYMEEIHSEDLLDNSLAYRHGHDGAFLLEGEHFLVKKGSQIKSATANVGTFSSTSDNIYDHRSNIQQALGIVERAEKALLAAKTEQETKAVEARFNAYLAEVLSPEIKVAGGNFGLRNGGNTTNLNLLRDVAELEKSATPEELNTLFITLSKKFVALDGTPKPFRITY